MAEQSSKTPAKATPAKATAASAPAPAEQDSAVRAYDPAPDFDRAKKGDSTEAGNLALESDVVGSTPVPGVDVAEQDAAIKEAGSADPADHQIREGNFYAPHLEGAGTILPGGGYGPPLPDPQVQRAKADEDYTVK